MSMTSRERVVAALAHGVSDRVPIDFGGHRSSGIMAIAYQRLRDYLGLPERLPRVYDLIQQLAIVDQDVLDRFGVDTIELGRGFCEADKWWLPWELPNGEPCLVPSWTKLEKNCGHWYLYSPDGHRATAVQKDGSLYFEQIHWPFANGIPANRPPLRDVFPEVMWAFPSPPGPAAIGQQELSRGAQRLRQRTDRAIIGLFGGNLLESLQFLLRTDNCFLLMAAEPKLVHELLDELVALHLENLDAFLGAVGPCIDCVLFGDDLGMQRGPQISPQMYREFFKDRHALLWRRAKELAPVKVQLHSCGGIAPLLDDLIEAGLDAVNPVQISAHGMDPTGLKGSFGQRLCLWGGGCDTQVVLPRDTPAAIREHVLCNLDILAPGGGYVFQQVHNIMADVPPENIVAMFDAVAEYNAGRPGS